MSNGAKRQLNDVKETIMKANDVLRCFECNRNVPRRYRHPHPFLQGCMVCNSCWRAVMDSRRAREPVAAKFATYPCQACRACQEDETLPQARGGS
jgi:hypothetical protein